MIPLDPPLAEGGVTAKPSTASERSRRLLTPDEVIEWLDRHRDVIADRWIAELRSRGEDVDEEVLALLREFVQLFVAFLAPGMGALRAQVEALVQQAAELFGSLGAHRGQAAGESVEEFQLLREVVLRFLYDDSPSSGSAVLGLRDGLLLNRLIDLGVTYASVGHTDALFFQHFHGTGVTDGPAPALLDEVQEQVAGLREDLERLSALDLEAGAERAN